MYLYSILESESRVCLQWWTVYWWELARSWRYCIQYTPYMCSNSLVLTYSSPISTVRCIFLLSVECFPILYTGSQPFRDSPVWLRSSIILTMFMFLLTLMYILFIQVRYTQLVNGRVSGYYPLRQYELDDPLLGNVHYVDAEYAGYYDDSTQPAGKDSPLVAEAAAVSQPTSSYGSVQTGRL